jgi:hypothetical protein
MRMSGLVFMVVTWAVILVLFLFSLIRTLTEKDE